MKLVILESPTKCKTISKYLGKDYEIISSYGHCVDLPKRKIGVSIKDDFSPTYEILEDKKKQMRTILSKAKKADEIYLMSDPDREGEAISWHIFNHLPKNKTVYRVKTNNLTKDKILEAFENRGSIDMDMVASYETRRILDRLVGFKCSYPVQRATGGRSVGRVQSATLRILAERELEIQNFKPQKYFNIECLFKKEKEFTALVKDPEPLNIKTEDEAKEICRKLNNEPIVVTRYKTSQASSKPYAPFKTSTLIQAASTFLGMSTKKTMSVAQKLFQSGAITYHRSDSVSMSKEGLSKVRSWIKSNLGSEKLPSKACFYSSKSKNAQEGHECIRPTSFKKVPSGAGDEARLYSLIWKRAVASQMNPAKYHRSSAQMTCSDISLSASGSRLIDLGFREIWDFSVGADSFLPKLKEGDIISPENVEFIEKETKPPFRYNEASIVKKLEAVGIGRPATYGSILSILKDRGYTNVEKRVLYVTNLGLDLIKFLIDVDFCFSDIQFTSQMEETLDKIQGGKEQKTPSLRKFWERLSDDLKRCGDVEKKNRATDHKCPKCESFLEKKHSRYGAFYGCSNYPDCRYTATVGDDGTPQEKVAKEKKEIVYSEYDCPLCDKKMVERKGRYGSFYGCSGYPKCRGIRDSEGKVKESKKKKWTKKGTTKKAAAKRTTKKATTGTKRKVSKTKKTTTKKTAKKTAKKTKKKKE